MKKVISLVILIFAVGIFFMYPYWTGRKHSGFQADKRQSGANTRQIGKALKIYKEEYGRYPKTLDQLVPSYSSVKLVSPWRDIAKDKFRFDLGNNSAKFEWGYIIFFNQELEYKDQRVLLLTPSPKKGCWLLTEERLEWIENQKEITRKLMRKSSNQGLPL